VLSLGVELIVLVLFVARRFSDEAKDGERRERKGEKGDFINIVLSMFQLGISLFALTMNNKEQRNNNSVRSPPAPHCNG
jgi:hypothetical protein